MPRLRTAKAVASRIDLKYFKRWHGLRGTRMILSLSCFVIALAVWGWYYRSDGGTRLYNPGPVAHSHAMVESNCAVCHDGDGKGGFFKTVSDTACLQCHDAAIHAPTQLQFTVLAPAHGGPAMSDKPEKKPGVTGRLTSSECTHCHTEHRGEAALRGVSDMHCVQCHADLAKHTKDGKPWTEPKVTAFTLDHHAAFGRDLTQSKEPGQKSLVLIDPTVLRFNHEKHMPMETIDNNCSKCHTTADPNPRAKPPTFAQDDGPPWNSDKDRPTRWDDSNQRAYMQPVSYEHHCQGCHRLDMPPNPGESMPSAILPHEKLEVVRAAVAGIPAEKLQWLAPKPKPAAAPSSPTTPSSPGLRPPPRVPPRYMGPEDEEPVMRLTTLGRPPPPRGGAAPPPGRGGTSAAGAPQQRETANEVAIRELEKKVRGAKPAVKQQLTEDIARLKELLKPPTTAPSTQPMETPWVVDPSIVELYAVYFTSNSCLMCHDLKGSVPRLAQANRASAPAAPSASASESAAAGAATMPAADAASARGAELLQTIATGIPSSSRRWYAHSQFDHRAHAYMKCVDCHSGAPASHLTSDVLSPNLSWKTADGTSHSCVDCHHAPTAESRGARADCQACHLYHDRTREGPPGTNASLAELVDWGNAAKMKATKATKAAPGPPSAKGSSNAPPVP